MSIVVRNQMPLLFHTLLMMKRLSEILEALRDAVLEKPPTGLHTFERVQKVARNKLLFHPQGIPESGELLQSICPIALRRINGPKNAEFSSRNRKFRTLGLQRRLPLLTIRTKMIGHRLEGMTGGE